MHNTPVFKKKKIQKKIVKNSDKKRKIEKIKRQNIVKNTKN